MTTWYAPKTEQSQGLVCDEDTGANIAVTYKAEDAPLVAAAPDLLELVEAFERLANNLLARDTFSAADFETLKSALRFTAPQRHDVIAKAKGE